MNLSAGTGICSSGIMCSSLGQKLVYSSHWFGAENSHLHHYWLHYPHINIQFICDVSHSYPKTWQDAITLKTAWRAMMEEDNLQYTMVPTGANKQSMLLIRRSAWFQKKTPSPPVPADLPQMASQHSLSGAIRALIPSAASPMQILDEQWHIRANSCVLAEWERLWDRETGILERFRSPNLYPPVFNVGCRPWTRLNRLLKEMARAAATVQKFVLVQSSQCDCRAAMQIVKHMVEELAIRRLEGGIQWLATLDDAAVR